MAALQSDIELLPSATPSQLTTSTSVDTGNASEETRRDTASVLAPYDTGRNAWLYVFSSFVLEMIVLGLPSSFGVFQVYYLSHKPFDTASESTINSIGTTALAIQYFIVPFLIAITQRRSFLIRPMQWLGLGLCSASLLFSSFAQAAWHLVALQGVLFGITSGLLYTPILIYLTEWFVRRRALAASIIFCGTGVGGIFIPLLVNGLLARIGLRWTLRVLAAIVGVAGFFSVLGVKSRLPVAPRSIAFGGSRATHATPASHTGANYTFIKTPLYLMLSLTIFVQALGYAPVSLYLPSYTSTVLGGEDINATLVLALFNLSTVFGQIVSGWACDNIGYTLMMSASAITSALTAYILWAYAHSLGLIYAFALIFGLVSGGFSSSYSSASTDVATSSRTQASMVMGSFGLFKGIAIIVGPIISAALHHESGLTKPHGYGGYGFTGIELFVGSMMAATFGGGLLSHGLSMRQATK